MQSMIDEPKTIKVIREAPDDIYFTLAREVTQKDKNLKYCIEENRFYFYTNGYWKDIHELELLDKLDESIRINHLNINQQQNVIKHLKRLIKMRLNKFNWTNELNLENGMYDPINNLISEHDYPFYSTIRIPYKYDESAKCELWLKSLDEILEGNQEKINILQEFFGQCLTRDVKQEKAMLLLGESRSGKSTILNTLQGMLGDKNCSSVPLKYFINPQFTSMMVNKLVNFDKDVSRKAQDFEEDFKKIVTGEEVSCNDKYVLPFTFRPFCKVVLSANIFPKITDYSSAFYNRLILIPCNRVFKPTEQNRHLREQLLKELPGVLNWSIIGLERLLKRGYFEEVSFMREAIEELEDDNNPTNVFFNDHIITEHGQEIDKSDLYNYYVTWSKNTNTYTLSKAKFSACVYKKYHTFTPKDTNNPDTKKRIWRNIKYVINKNIINSDNLGWQDDNTS